jgi:hypothetical protein
MNNDELTFFEKTLGTLYRPRVVFNSIDEDDMTKGLIIMIVMVLLTAYSSMIYMSKIPLSVLSPQLEGVDVTQFERNMGILAGVGTGITIIIGWLASTLLIHGVGRISGGGGTLKRFLAMHGFASLPSLLNQFIRVVDALVMDSDSLTNYFLTYQDIESKALKAFLGTNLFNLWGLATLALLVFAIEENYKVNKTRSILIVLLPSLIYFLFNYIIG